MFPYHDNSAIRNGLFIAHVITGKKHYQSIELSITLPMTASPKMLSKFYDSIFCLLSYVIFVVVNKKEQMKLLYFSKQSTNSKLVLPRMNQTPSSLGNHFGCVSTV